MLAEDLVVLGIDLRSGYYQMSFFHQGMSEPKMLLPVDELSSDFELSAFVFEDPLSGERGIDFSKPAALRQSLKPDCSIRNIFYDDIEGTGLDRSSLLAMFLRNCMEILKANVPDKRAAALCFTGRFPDPSMQTELRRAFELLDLREVSLYFEDYMESYYHYLIRQKKTAFDERSVVFYRSDDEIVMGSLVFRNRLLENSVSGNEDAVLNMPAYWSPEKKDSAFSDFVQNRLSGYTVSSVFVVTEDLNLMEMTASRRALSDKGHIFAGNNLFVQGAAYSAYARACGTVKKENYLGNDRIKHDIYIEARCNKRVQKVILAGAEQKFYDIHTTLDIITNDRESFVFHTRNVETAKVSSYEIKMSGIPQRPDFTTRLRIDLSFAGVGEFMVEVRDLGFGGLFPTSGLVFKEVFEFR